MNCKQQLMFTCPRATQPGTIYCVNTNEYIERINAYNSQHAVIFPKVPRKAHIYTKKMIRRKVSKKTSEFRRACDTESVVFKFRPIPHNIMREKINKITLLEDMNITNDGINLILKVANGDMRKLLNILQSLNMIKQDYYNSINEQNNKIF